MDIGGVSVERRHQVTRTYDDIFSVRIFQSFRNKRTLLFNIIKSRLVEDMDKTCCLDSQCRSLLSNFSDAAGHFCNTPQGCRQFNEMAGS